MRKKIRATDNPNKPNILDIQLEIVEEFKIRSLISDSEKVEGDFVVELGAKREVEDEIPS